MDDKELDSCIKRFKKTGDNLYFEKIYRFFFQKIYRFVLLNTSDRHMAEDITVDVFYKVYKYMSKINLNPISFKPWIYKIARNLIIDYYRKDKRQIKSQSFDSLDNTNSINSLTISDISIENNSTELNEALFNNPKLLEGFRSLSDIQRQVIVLRFLEELDYKTIGMIINKREFAVRTIKYRAITKLKEKLTNSIN
jgi:RNA polymerase sigma-70 factor (ECF subfamily)